MDTLSTSWVENSFSFLKGDWGIATNPPAPMKTIVSTKFMNWLRRAGPQRHKEMQRMILRFPEWLQAERRDLAAQMMLIILCLSGFVARCRIFIRRSIQMFSTP